MTIERMYHGDTQREAALRTIIKAHTAYIFAYYGISNATAHVYFRVRKTQASVDGYTLGDNIPLAIRIYQQEYHK